MLLLSYLFFYLDGEAVDPDDGTVGCVFIACTVVVGGMELDVEAT